jgi:hypothetical protein
VTVAPVLAHAAHGNLLGAPELFLEIGLLVVVGLTVVALRATWTEPRLERAAAGRLLPSWSVPVGRAAVAVAAVLGAAVWATSLVAAVAATDDPTENLASFVASLSFVVGGGVLLALVSDGWWRAASPFATIARALPASDDDEGDDREAPVWVAPLMVGSFLWLATAYHDGGQVRSIGAWFVLYTIAGLAGTVRWGRRWAEAGEGFAELFGTVGHLAPLTRDAETGRVRLRLPLTGVGGREIGPSAVATLLVTGGGVAFGALSSLDWWQLEVVQDRSGWARTAVDTAGLAFTIGVAALVWVLAQRMARSAGTGLVSVAAGVVVAFLLTDLVMRTVDVLALASDPFGKGWDLFGTSDWFPDLGWQSSPRLAWVEIAAITVGAALAAVAARDAALATGDRRRAALVARAETAATTVLALGALVLLLR